MRAPLLLLLTALALGLGAVVACSDDENLTPSVVPDAGPGANEAGIVVPPGEAGCASNRLQCNTCTTGELDPYNACTDAVTNCVPFDPRRIPEGPGGGVPVVP